MARITVEDCLEVVDNRFELVLMATKRARQLAKGADPLVVNEDFQTAVGEMCAIFVASRLRRPQQQARHAGLIRSLLADDRLNA